VAKVHTELNGGAMQLITRAEIANLAYVSRAAVTQWVKRHQDFPRPDTDGRFRQDEVMTWLAARPVRGSARPADDRDRGSYADRARLRMAAATATTGKALPGEAVTAPADNLLLQLTLLCLRLRKPDIWTRLESVIPPDNGAGGARWLLRRIEKDATVVARQFHVHPEVFVALRRLTPDNVAQVRGIMARSVGLRPDDVQDIIDSYEAALPAGDFLTPRPVADLLAGAVIDETATTVHDPYLRAGELLTSAAQRGPRTLRLSGLAADPAALSRTGLNLLTRGQTADLRLAEHRADTPASRILANPPFGTAAWLDALPDRTWRPFPLPAARSAYRWLLYCLGRLSASGRMAIIMPVTAAYSVNGRDIRRYLVERSMVEAVVALPAGLYAGPTVATTMWIVRPEHHEQPILFIDAARLGTYDGGRVLLGEEAGEQILQTWRAFTVARDAGYSLPDGSETSVSVTRVDVQQAGWSLDPTRFVLDKARPVRAGTETQAGLWRLLQEAVARRHMAEDAVEILAQPIDVPVVELGSVCDVQTGYPYDRLRADQRDDQNGVPIVLPRHLRDGGVHVGDGPFAPAALAGGLHRYMLHADDVLCVRTGALTPPALAVEGQEGWLVSTNLLRLRTLDQRILDPRYLHAYLRSEAGRQNMSSFAQGTSTAYVSAAAVAALKIPLPSLDQQLAVLRAVNDLNSEADAVHQLATKVAEARDASITRFFGGAR
jgi:type I restriction enzyme M protein